jgi:structural maintenance of chromosomes protein 5
MTSLPTRRRQRAVIEDEAEADRTRYSAEPSPQGDQPKRARLSGRRSSFDAEDAQDEDQDSDSTLQNEDREFSAKPDFQPGAIVRVQVGNFVTYEHAEFEPGPNLNMVIGPNGTGKSSLVCAICLGLGYPANVLGRASSFGDFVKHGKDYATVEIELQKRRKDRQNFVIRLRINREDNTRKFWLNGRETSLKNIQSLMKTLRIQIDNLCQFLPQDKVAEFAGINSIDLLTKTLQAAAPPLMIGLQNELKEIYAAQKGARRQIEVDAEQLKILESRQQGLQADVARLREKEEIEENIRTLEIVKSIVIYNTAREQYAAARERKKELAANLRRLEETSGPSLQAVNRKQEYQQAIESVLEDCKGKLKDAEDAADLANQKIEQIADSVAEQQNGLSACEITFQRKRKEVGTWRQKITGLEAKLKAEPKEFVAADWNTRIVCFELSRQILHLRC